MQGKLQRGSSMADEIAQELAAESGRSPDELRAGEWRAIARALGASVQRLIEAQAATKREFVELTCIKAVRRVLLQSCIARRLRVKGFNTSSIDMSAIAISAG